MAPLSDSASRPGGAALPCFTNDANRVGTADRRDDPDGVVDEVVDRQADRRGDKRQDGQLPANDHVSGWFFFRHLAFAHSLGADRCRLATLT